ncbi:MAG: PQQ-binding-like beta-propeller repeat protein [Candidatus Pelagibacter sp.]
MNKILLFILISFFLVNCSLNKNSRLWNEKEKDLNENKNLTKIFVEEKKESSELNPLIKLDLSKNQQNNKIVDNLNNFGSLKYNGSLNKIANFKFAKFNNFSQFDFEPLILKDGLIFFDKKGNILRFNDNQKIIWKKNYYSKTEKKLNPKLLFSMKGKNLIVADNIAKIFLVNSISGDLIWSKKSDYPFNSQIKIYKDRFFVVDYKNILRCFYLKDGSECWNVQTEDSFTISNSKYSLIIVNDLVIFNNSVGDITAVNILSGLIKWQLPTQKNSIINETYNFNYSRLVSDGNSIYFSNNKNQFFSVDLNTGTTNWISEVSSILTPVIIGNYIFTVSEDGYLFTFQKKQGNIIRINDLYKNYDLKKRKKLKPIGFLVGQNNLYLTNSDGALIVVKLISGNILKIEKVSRGLISKPYIYNGELFIVKNGSIVKYD